MPLNQNIVSRVIGMNKDDAAVSSRKQTDILKDFQTLFTVKYPSITRFNAEDFQKELDAKANMIRSFVEEKEERVNQALVEAERMRKMAEDAGTPTEGNRWHDAYMAMCRGFSDLYDGFAWTNMNLYAFEEGMTKHYDAMRQIKDIEIETQKIEAEKAYFDMYVADSREQIRIRDRHIVALQAQVLQLTQSVTNLFEMIKEINPAVQITVAEPQLETPEPEPTEDKQEKPVPAVPKKKARVGELA